MNKKDSVKIIIANIIIAVITTFVVMLILKVNLNLGNFIVLFIISIVIFLLGNLIFFK